MILSIVLLLIVALVAYLHWIQGLLSGLISAVLAILSACVAISYYEPLAYSISGGKFNDQSQGVLLISLFAVTYLVLRILFDKFIPGNIRLPHLVDGIGGATCGAIAGTCAAGIVAIAMQSMPFGPSIAGYARYTVEDDKGAAVFPEGASRAVDRLVKSPLKAANLDDGKEKSTLLLPADDIVVGLVSHLSGSGALAADKPFASIHPDLMQELFGQRIGVEVGAKRTASNKTSTQVSVGDLYAPVAPLPKVDAEVTDIRKVQSGGSAEPFTPKDTFVAPPDETVVTVAVKFLVDATDDQGDRLTRLSPGSIRLVAKDLHGDWKNYFPVGTIEDGKIWVNRVDDPLFFKEETGGHFVFVLSNKAFKEPPVERQPKPLKLAEGSFIEVKRLVKAPLEDKEIKPGLPPNRPEWWPMRKTKLKKRDPAAEKIETAGANTTPDPIPPTPRPGTTSPETTIPTPPVTTTNPPVPTPPTTTNPPTPPMAADNGFAAAPLGDAAFLGVATLPVDVSVGEPTPDIDPVATTAATGAVKARKFTSLEIDPIDDAALDKLPAGGNAIREFHVPDGQRMVQVVLKPKAGEANTWIWAAAPGDYTVVDGAGSAYKPKGVIARVTGAGSTPAEKLFVRYAAASDLATVPAGKGNVTTVTFVYLIPKDAKAKEIRFQGKEGGAPLEK